MEIRMKKYITILSLVLGTTMCAFPADIDRNEFNLVAKVDKKQPVVVAAPAPDMNDLIYLKARIKELEKENAELKKNKSINLDFGTIYVADSKLKCKDLDGVKDWDWNGKTWVRDSVEVTQPSKPIIQQLQWTFPQSTCPNGRCPNTR